MIQLKNFLQLKTNAEISIKNVDCEYLWNDSSELVTTTDEVYEEWDSFSDEEKQQFYTTRKHRFSVNAEHVLERIFEEINYSDYSYDALYDALDDEMTEENINKLQKTLDEIMDNDTFCVYIKDKKIVD